MANPHKPGGRRLDPDDVIAGRGKPPAARDLIELIRAENPTGLELPAKETARRYARKARLQSLLIDRFADDLEVTLDPREPGVVGILYRPLDMHACHVPLEALDDDARSWAQGEIDRKAFDEAHPPAVTMLGKRGGEGLRRPVAPDSKASHDRDRTEVSVVEQVRRGQEAIDAYDYELARTHLARALTLASGDVEAALPLLALLVDHLAADEEALGVEAHLSPAARKHPEARLLLGLAAARSGQRERAKALLEGHRGARSGEPFLVLARAALASGDVDAAAHDVAAVRERDPIHPHLRDLESALAARRAQERLPIEDALTRLLEGGHVEDAEARARALLARFPDSEVGRRALRAIEEIHKATQIQRLLAEADEAAARAELTLALALLRRALAAGPRGEEAASIRERVARIDATLRDCDEHAQVEKAVALLGASDRLAGLLAYLALGEAPRRLVRARVDLPHFGWLAEISSGERPRAAALAALDLERAGAMVAEAPQAALEKIDEHARALQGVGRRAEIERDARARLGVLRREAAKRRVEEARACFEAGAVERAEALLGPEALGDLDPSARAFADELRAQIARAQDERILIVSYEQRRRDGALLQARDAVDTLLARALGPSRERWTAIRGEVGAEIHKAFRLRVDATPRPVRSLRHIDLESVSGVPRLLRPGSLTIPLVQTWGTWVFVRVIDLPSRIEQKRFLLSTPAPLHVLTVEVDEDRVVVVGKLGAVLELDITDGEILGWYEGSERREPTAMVGDVDTSIPEEMVEDAVFVPTTRLLWRVVRSTRGRKRSVHIVDLARRRIVRTLGDMTGRVYLDPIFARREPLMAVIKYDEETLDLHDLRGAPLGDSKLAIAAIPCAIVAEPRGERLVIFTGARRKKVEADRTPLRWCTFLPGVGASPEQLVPGRYEGDCAVVTDPASGLLFVQTRADEDKDDINELRAFRLEDGDPSAPHASLEQLYCVPVSPRVMLVECNRRPGVTAVVPSDDDFEVATLGPEPPQLRLAPRVAHIRFRAMTSMGLRCNKPTGARRASMMALAAAMQREPRSAWTRRWQTLQQEGDAGRMVDFGFALEHLGEPGEAGLIGGTAYRKFPEHPEIRLGHARAFANIAQWSVVRDLLGSADPSGLDAGSARHLHHLLGLSLLHLSEPEEARRVLERGAGYSQGTCDLAALLALATPLAEPRAAPELAWTSEQLALREIVAAIEAADACLSRGDTASATVALDRLVVTEAGEVQSLARRAEARLLGNGSAEAEEIFDKACTLAWFCAANAEKKPLLRRELPIPRGRWDLAKLDDLAARASRWLDATLGEAWPQPAGGL